MGKSDPEKTGVPDTDATKAAIGAALHLALSPFHEVGESTLGSVSEFYEYGCRDRLVLDFGAISLVIVADSRDDTIDYRTVRTAECQYPYGADVSESANWKGLIGQRFGWGWITVNQQGHCDGLVLSFGGITPQVLLNVRASSIYVQAIAAT